MCKVPAILPEQKTIKRNRITILLGCGQWTSAPLPRCTADAVRLSSLSDPKVQKGSAIPKRPSRPQMLQTIAPLTLWRFCHGVGGSVLSRVRTRDATFSLRGSGINRSTTRVGGRVNLYGPECGALTHIRRSWCCQFKQHSNPKDTINSAYVRPCCRPD